MNTTIRKRNGIHYTPAALATFLANRIVDLFERQNTNVDQPKRIRILDPACGDGELLSALVSALPRPARQLRILAFDKDEIAVETTRRRLSELGLTGFEVHHGDFLDDFDTPEQSNAFDVVIANPPYVRTQVLGGEVARRLARRFKLRGRVDLYHAFTIAMSQRLENGGVLGLLTSNRFLTVRSGDAMRRFLDAEFDIRQVFDLGDTRLFEAAVLPAIVIATRRIGAHRGSTGGVSAEFHRIYKDPSQTGDRGATCCVLDLVADQTIEGPIATRQGSFLIERGRLAIGADDVPWSLTNQGRQQWLSQVRSRQRFSFGELAEIKVGIKTTADAVFIRESWDDLPSEQRPEKELLRPLLTHRDAARWCLGRPAPKQVLYPYQPDAGNRTPVKLQSFPRTGRYLHAHRQRLAGREYVLNAGRQWYEIWVPHQPHLWSAPKLVWPDISEEPRFLLDPSGAIVNGDCYWLILRPGIERDWIYLMLAVANSSVATDFYDNLFHNKLYAGRRRFMTQYVKEFPLPDPELKGSKRIIQMTKQQTRKPQRHREKQLEILVRKSFGI